MFEYNDSLSAEEKTESYFNLVEYVTTFENKVNLSETVGGAKIPEWIINEMGWYEDTKLSWKIDDRNVIITEEEE